MQPNTEFPQHRFGTPGSRRRITLMSLAVLLIFVLAVGATDQGAAAVANIQAFLEFFSGVCVLVGLTGLVVFGLLTASRFVPIRLRLLAQSAHRSVAVLAMGFLVVHVTVKILEKHATIADVIFPVAGLNGRGMWVSLGPIAADLMVLAFITGVVRGRFITRGRTWVWRVLHATGYLSWPIALLHGLEAGRAAKSWVILSYLVSVAVVVAVAQARFMADAKHRRTTRPAPAPDLMGAAQTVAFEPPAVAVRSGRSGRSGRAGRSARSADAPVADRHMPDEEFWASMNERKRRNR